MEQWQRDHILKHLVELIKNTTINTHLIASFKAKHILTDNDAEAIEHPMLMPSEKSKKLYEILPNRTRSFEVLIETLTDARQSGAVKILREHTAKFRDYGSISVDENHVLGTGNSSKVFKGKFENRDVAVKVLHTNLVDPEMIRREVEFLRKLDSHENIIRHFIAESHETCIFIALELCLISLQDEVSIKLLKIDPTSTLFQSTKGLNHLHKHNVVHRDLKPANILLTANKHVKIADFGLSKQIPIGMSTITVHSGSLGTPDWMAPEILEYFQQGIPNTNTLKMSKSTDVFSLGCIFYFTLTDGSHPFGNNLERIYNISNHNPKIMEERIPTDWVELIRRMISQFSGTRPTTNEILNSKYFGSSTSAHVKSNTPSINAEVQAIHDVNMLEGQNSKSAAKSLDERADEELVTAALETEKLFPKEQPKPNISPMTATKLQPSTYNIDILNSANIPIARHIKGRATTTVFKPYSQSLRFQPLNHKTNDENDFKENDRDSMSNEVKTCIEICNQMLQEEKYKGRGLTLFHMAVELEYKAAVEHLISDGAYVNKGDNDGITSLHQSCRSDKSMKEIFPILMQNGGNINAVNKNEECMLFLAAKWGKSKETLIAIVRAGANITLKTNCGETIMHAAVIGGNSDAINYFKSIGFDINSRNGREETPLHYMLTSKENFFEKLNVALENGADTEP